MIEIFFNKIIGGPGSGKTEIGFALQQHLGRSNVIIISHTFTIDVLTQLLGKVNQDCTLFVDYSPEIVGDNHDEWFKHTCEIIKKAVENISDKKYYTLRVYITVNKSCFL
jgi:hypothetical protein